MIQYMNQIPVNLIQMKKNTVTHIYLYLYIQTARLLIRTIYVIMWCLLGSITVYTLYGVSLCWKTLFEIEIRIRFNLLSCIQMANSVYIYDVIVDGIADGIDSMC